MSRTDAPHGGEPEKAGAIERATGTSWPEWRRIMADGGAADADHAGLARIAHDAMDERLENPGWWAQSVAVAYEQDTGRRVKGQASDGSFQVSATRTLPGTMDEVFDAWLARAQELTEIDGTEIVDGPRETGTPKRRHWRIGLADGTRAVVSAEGKGEGRAFLTATHTKLPSAEQLERWRTVWKDQLAGL
ncbi:hypothetical protein M3E18_11185 [Kocuria sp. p3-SID1433]|uniref:hypothetical protein n=1 Tax=unclassified Kocuria TaxID=2649579 RepID=UPI0021A3CC59|nr:MULTISPECIES: hypothetical protein [unclassified Kocuria]MCT1601589.1 hypothetical protein [Kocuria sp. p3-SID1428]MCT2181087.1 hypothetical protein [Kocuria sp. p3-SID1433]